MIQELDSPVEETAIFKFHREFMAMTHNYLCAVCREDKAVIDTSTGILQPCWSCQKHGYKVLKLNKIQSFLLGLFK